MASFIKDMKKEASKHKEILFRSGLSARQFSETLRISESQMSNILRGNRRPSRELLDRLVEHFHVDLNWLLRNDPTIVANWWVSPGLHRQQCSCSQGYWVYKITYMILYNNYIAYMIFCQ